MTQRARVGILGLGAAGRIHAQALRELSDRAEVTAFSGVDAADAVSVGWPGAAFLEPDELVGAPNVDVVAVCSPSEYHGRNAISALENGKHVVAEKPLALTVEEADRIVELGRERNLLVSPISQRRFETDYAELKKLLGSGALGEVRLVTTHAHWWRTNEYYQAAPWRGRMWSGGGSLMNQGVHTVDLIQWLCGRVVEVTAQYGTLGHQIEAEDTTVATLRFASGALGLLSTSTATPPGSPATVAIYTDRGVVELGQGGILRWEVDGVAPPAGCGNGASGAADPLAIGIEGHKTQWRDVLNALAEGREPAVTAESGAAGVRLMCAIYESADTGVAVRPTDLSRTLTW